jgi:uncharacterized protein YbjT (DUF2867 family)
LLADSDHDKVILLTRRPLALSANPKLEQKITDFENLASLKVGAVETIFCALGTTIKKAGSQAAFRHVDFEIPLAVAKLGLQSGARQFVLVSSVGASADSSNFYLRTKGELERELQGLPFAALHIFRPSFLVGQREEVRVGERLAIPAARALQFLMAGPLRRYRSIQAESVGRAMVAAANSGKSGSNVYEYDQIVKLAAG